MDKRSQLWLVGVSSVVICLDSPPPFGNPTLETVANSTEFGLWQATLPPKGRTAQF
jgi:hypothetical protein